MVLKHRVDFTPAADDFNEKGNIKLSSLLFFCQEGATQHADIIGIGMETLFPQNIIWVLVKTRLKILKDMKQGESYYLETFPRKQKSRYCPRDYYIYDMNGEPVVIGTSIWSLVDYTTRKMIKKELEFGGEFTTVEPFEDDFAKIRMKEAVEAGKYTVAEKDIDSNEHTNNCTYADMIELVADTEGISEFTIQFSKETKFGDTVQLQRQPAEDGVMVSGTLPGGETVFLAKMTMR